MLPWHSLWWHLLGKAGLGHSLLPSGSSSSSVPPLSCPSRACNRCQCQAARQLKAPGPGHPGTTSDSCTRVIHQEGTLLRLQINPLLLKQRMAHRFHKRQSEHPLHGSHTDRSHKNKPNESNSFSPATCGLPWTAQGPDPALLCHWSRELSAARLP